MSERTRGPCLGRFFRLNKQWPFTSHSLGFCYCITVLEHLLLFFNGRRNSIITSELFPGARLPFVYRPFSAFHRIVHLTSPAHTPRRLPIRDRIHVHASFVWTHVNPITTLWRPFYTIPVLHC